MTDFALRVPVVADASQQTVNEDLLLAVNQIGQFLFWGSGVPTFTPPDSGPAIFLREDGGAGTTLYCWSGAAWAAFA